MIQRPQPRRVEVGLARLDGERSLPWRRRASDRIDEAARHVAEAQTIEPGGRQQDGVRLTPFHFGEPGVDVSAQRDDRQIRAVMPGLRLAAQAGCSQTGPDRQGLEAVPGRAQKGVARILAFGNGGDHQAWRADRRHVL